MKIENKPLYTVYEVMAILGCSISKGYQIIKDLNNEMERQGYYTIAGKVNSQYFRDKFKIKEEEIKPFRDISEVVSEVKEIRRRSNEKYKNKNKEVRQ